MYLVAIGMLALRTEKWSGFGQFGVELVFEMIDNMIPENKD